MDIWQSDAFESGATAATVKADLLTRLKYTHHSLFDWRPLPHQSLETITTDGLGLRSPADPGGSTELTCMVLGGSFAWGFGAASNAATPAGVMAATLTELAGRTINVVSLAEQAYSSIQEIKSFVFLVDEIRPDLVVCITGVNDIGRGFSDAYKREPRYVAASEFLNWGIGVGIMSDRINDIPRWKKAARIMLRDHRVEAYPGDDFFTLAKPAREEIPHVLLARKVELLTAVCAWRRIKLAFVLQPVIFCKQPLSEYEHELWQEHQAEMPEYTGYYRHHRCLMAANFADRSKAAGGPLFLDSGDFVADHPETLFFDGMHMGDRGYATWTRQLCRRLEPLLD